MNMVWSPRAVGHLRQIREYIAEDDPGAAARVAEKILASVELVARQRLELIAVFHGRQKWPSRF